MQRPCVDSPLSCPLPRAQPCSFVGLRLGARFGVAVLGALPDRQTSPRFSRALDLSPAATRHLRGAPQHNDPPTGTTRASLMDPSPLAWPAVASRRPAGRRTG